MAERQVRQATPKEVANAVKESGRLVTSIVANVVMGEKSGFHYALAVNESLLYLVATVSRLISEQVKGVFPEKWDKGVAEVLRYIPTAFRKYDASPSGKEYNLQTADQLDKLGSILINRGSAGLLRCETLPVQIVTLDDIELKIKGGSPDRAINDEVVYLVDSYIRLRSAQPPQFAQELKSELKRTADAIATSLEEVSKIDEAVLIGHDNDTAKAIRVFGTFVRQ
jgi:hypothetical protein